MFPAICLLAAAAPFSVALAQTGLGSLPRVSAPGAFGDSVTTGAAAGSSTARALAPPPGIGASAEAGLNINISIGASRHSNPERLPEGSDSRTDTAFSLAPSITLGGDIGRHQYELGYNRGSRRFGDIETRDADYERLEGALRLDLTRILVADLYASRVESEELPGVSGTREIGRNERLDEFHIDTLGGRVTLGRRANLLQLFVGAETSALEFTNNDQDFRDRDEDMIEGGLFFNVGTATSLFLHAQQRNIDYLVGNPSLDSTETSLTAGVTWEATDAVSLVFEAGQLEKEFDDPAIEGFDGTTYLGKLLWSPRDRTSVSLYASRTTEESPDFDSAFLISELAGIDIRQEIGARGSMSLYYTRANDEFSNSRVDDITDYGIGFGYSVFTWMDLGAGYNRVRRESTDPGFEFVDDVYNVFVNIKPRIGSRN